MLRVQGAFSYLILALVLCIPTKVFSQHVFSPEDYIEYGINPSWTPSTPPPSFTLPPSRSPSPSPSQTPSTPTPSLSPSRSPSPSPSRSPSPSLSPSQTPSTPTPTPTPVHTPRPICEYMAIDVKQTGFQGFDSKNYQEIRALGRTSKVGKCLNSKIDEALSFCNGTNGKTRNRGKADYLDDCMVEILMGNAYVGADDPSLAYWVSKHNDKKERVSKSILPKNYGFAKSCGVCNESIKAGTSSCSTIAPTNNQCAKDKKVGGGLTIGTVYEGSLYLDSNCNSVNFVPEVEDQCREDMYFKVTPISLIWNELANTSDKTLVKFPLDMSRPENLYTEWRGSEHAPLLVYDPERSGKITGAHQLFGDWTFGGKQVASMASGVSLSSKWDNGYEALASLDANNNSAIDGAELAQLSLWFDKNKKGVSEEGEVKTLSDLGVSKVYFKNAKIDSITSDLILDIGYERIVDGKAVVGRSVDWHSNTYQSENEAVLFNTSSNQALEKTSFNFEIKASRSNKAEDVSGVWEWKSIVGEASNQDAVFGGILILDSSGEAFEAVSINERVMPGTSGVNEINEIALFKLYGAKVSENQYKLSTKKNGINIDTQIKLVRDGEELEGKTTIINKSGTLTYNWLAHRK